MRAHPMISATAATGLSDAIVAAGGDPDNFLAERDLHRSMIVRRDGFIACSDFARLLEDAASALADPCFGLRLGERYDPKNIGSLIYAVVNAPTIASALETAARYLHVHNEAVQVSIETRSQLVYFRYVISNVEVDEPRQFNEYSAAVTLNVLRMMAGSQWAPREVQFAHRAPGDTAHHQRLFRAPITFACATNAFVMERAFFDKAVPAADPRLFEILRRYLEDILCHMPKEDEVLAAVRRAIAESMREGQPRLPCIAKLLARSSRTLQRLLESHGQNFKDMVDDTRRRFALDYLKNSANTLSEIAFLLGYSEVSAFNRAFKRWTKQTPLSYRRSIGVDR